MADYLLALALTVIVEVPIYAGVLARSEGPGDGAVTGAIANLVSHPLAFVLAFPLLDGVLGATAAVVVAEVLVIVVEATVARARGNATEVALVVSPLANVASLVVGVAIFT